MKQVILAVLLSAVVWPGAGQLYNREFRKGLILIGLTFLFGISLFLGAGVEIAKRLPPDMSMFGPDNARIIADEVLRANAKMFLTFNLLVMATWLFAVVDAYLGARDRMNPPDSQAGEPRNEDGPLT